VLSRSIYKEGIKLAKREKNENLIPKKICADQVVRELQSIHTYLKWALGLVAVGVVVSPVSFLGAVPGVGGLFVLGWKFNQIKMKVAYLKNKYGLM